jgi:FdhD protein
VWAPNLLPLLQRLYRPKSLELNTTLPFLSQAHAPVVREVNVTDEFGQRRTLFIPAERALTLYVDKRELVTLMTLGAHPEWLVLGYLRNQRLVESVEEIESITVDWEVGAAAVKTRRGISEFEKRTEKRVVTTGCGQGSLFGDLLDSLQDIRLPDASVTQSQIAEITDTIRLQDSIYKKAGSVHGCALFATHDTHAEKLIFVEDVGRHNAIDTIAGWMWLQGVAPVPLAAGSMTPTEGRQPCSGQPNTAAIVTSATEGLVFYTTGRLTSEMVMKSAQMGIPIVVSRSGMTEMGLALAQQLNLCAIGRATHKRFLCFSAPERVKWQAMAKAA